MTLQVWLLTLFSLGTMVAVMAQVTEKEASLYNTESRCTFAKATLWGFKAFIQEGESPGQGVKNSTLHNYVT